MAHQMQPTALDEIAELLAEHGFDGLASDTPYDLLIRRDGAEAEVACETISAEEGRPVHRGDWYALVDRVNPELQTWLAAHPGRYLLKMTLPEGLSGPERLSDLHRRIMGLLQEAGATRIGFASEPLPRREPARAPSGSE